MYEPPIKEFIGEIQTQYEDGVLRAVHEVGFCVDKEELLKALMYDRDQYEKGYEDGINENKWIPCSERLPSDDRLYDITYQNHTGIHTGVAIFNTYNDRWYWECGTLICIEKVLAWAERIKRAPYKPKED